MPASSKPRVIDFSSHLSGPLTSHYLVELGAEVVKVEHHRHGDGNRRVSPLIHGSGMIHVNSSAGTRSMAADTRSPHWPEVVAACARWADVVIVGSRPSDAARRGLGFSAISAANPDIVYCAISGYGTTGPWSDRPAHGHQMDAFAGNAPVEWLEGSPGTPRGFRTAGTTAAAMFAAMGIFAALNRRHDEDGPFFVDVSGWGAAMSWQWRDMTTLANLGHRWIEYDEAGSRYAMHRTSDDRALLLCPLERRFWESLCDVLALPERRAIGDWERGGGMDWGTGAGYEGERELIAERIARRTLGEWTKILEPTGVPFAPMLSPEEALASEHAAANCVLGQTTVDGKPAWFTRAAVHVSRTDAPRVEALELSPPPAVGQDTERFLEELGLGHLKSAFPAAR